MATLSILPVRVPIGRVMTPDGRTLDVLMTPEFARTLASMFTRIGGATGLGNEDIAALAASDASSGQVLALLNEVQQLRALAETVAPAVAMYRQIEAMRAELAMIEDPAAQVRYILTHYAPLLSPKFQGIPTAPTAAADTNTDQLATTKFVLGQGSTVNPVIDGVAAPGTSTRFARGDHVHPTDTSRQAAISAATVTGSRGGNAALTSLLTGLAGQGLITNSTTA